jgi:hypothetical protein
MAWIAKGIKSLPFLVLHFFINKMLVALQKAHAVSILKQVVITRESSSRLGILLSLPSLSLVDLLRVTSGGFNF